MTARIIPTFRYRDTAAAIEFLCTAFGFEKHLVVPGPDGGVVHSQLKTQGGMVMLSDARDEADSAFDAMQKPPDATGGVLTSSAYIIIDDFDAHYARAVEAGAEIVVEPHAPEHGGQFYGCKDPQGQLWSFGTYDPWVGDSRD